MFKRIIFNAYKQISQLEGVLHRSLSCNRKFKIKGIQTFKFPIVIYKKQINNATYSNSTSYKTILAFSLLGLLGGELKEIDPEEEIIMTMKRAILCTQRSEYNKAEQLLHIALNMAQKQNNTKAITYVYDLMANLAMERKEWNKAKILFVNVLQQLFQDGIEENDLKVIHISLKVANIHTNLNYLPEAEVGYKWCLEQLQTTNKDNSNKEDIETLRGIILDYYAQLHLKNNNVTKAVDCMQKSLQICIDLYGEENVQTVKVLNDLASMYWQARDLNNAEKCFKQSLKLLETLPPEEQKIYTGVLKSNLGVLLLERGLLDEAERMCKEAWHIANKSNDKDVLNQANYCLNQILENKKSK